jgi:hypothetical protein
VDTTGPVHGAVQRHGTSLVLSVERVGDGAGLQLRGARGFEVLSSGRWQTTKVAAHTRDTVTLAPVPADATKLRYSWYSNPCGEQCFQCAVYTAVAPLGDLSGEEPFLPLAPFVMAI